MCGNEHELFTHSSNTVDKNLTLHLNLKQSSGGKRQTMDHMSYTVQKLPHFFSFSAAAITLMHNLK